MVLFTEIIDASCKGTGNTTIDQVFVAISYISSLDSVPPPSSKNNILLSLTTACNPAIGEDRFINVRAPVFVFNVSTEQVGSYFPGDSSVDSPPAKYKMSFTAIAACQTLGTCKKDVN